MEVSSDTNAMVVLLFKEMNGYSVLIMKSGVVLLLSAKVSCSIPKNKFLSTYFGSSWEGNVLGFISVRMSSFMSLHD